MREKKEFLFCVFSNSFSLFFLVVVHETRDTALISTKHTKNTYSREREREREREIACVNECSECITKEYKTENGRSTLLKKKSSACSYERVNDKTPRVCCRWNNARCDSTPSFYE